MKRNESGVIRDFFRNPPPGLKPHRMRGMTGEEYAGVVDHHMRTGELPPPPPPPLEGDCRQRLRRFVETMKEGTPLQECLAAVAQWDEPPPCEKKGFLRAARGLPGGLGGGKRHPLGPAMWCVVEGLLRDDAFSAVRASLEQLLGREAELDGAEGGTAAAGGLFRTEEEVWRARRAEVMRTPYHLLTINVTDAETGVTREHRVADLCEEGQRYVTNGGLESREDVAFFMPPQWRDPSPPPGPGDVVGDDGEVILRCPFPNDTAPPWMPYPLLGHYLGNDHPFTMDARRTGGPREGHGRLPPALRWEEGEEDKRAAAEAYLRDLKVRDTAVLFRSQIEEEWRLEREGGCAAEGGGEGGSLQVPGGERQRPPPGVGGLGGALDIVGQLKRASMGVERLIKQQRRG